MLVPNLSGSDMKF